MTKENDDHLNYYEYLDFRSLLSDFVEIKNKKSKGRFSYRHFAQKCGFKSPNYVRLIVQDKRNVSNDAALRLSKAMQLNTKETDFFLSLIGFNQAKDAESKSVFFNKIASYKEFKKVHGLTRDQYIYFSKWYNVAIREMVNISGFRMDYDWISQNLVPSVPIKEVKESLDLLIRLNLIEKNDQQQWKQTHQHVETSSLVSSSFLYNFHQEMIFLSKQSLQQSAKTRKVSAVTMAISQEEFDEINKLMDQFQKNIQKLLTKKSSKPDRVCQFNQQLFTLTDMNPQSTTSRERMQ